MVIPSKVIKQIKPDRGSFYLKVRRPCTLPYLCTEEKTLAFVKQEKAQKNSKKALKFFTIIKIL